MARKKTLVPAGPEADIARRLHEEPGRPLDGMAKSRMERSFGHDFSRVRIHDANGSPDLAAEAGARAFTVGSHIAFARGEYRPHEPAGEVILAHELAHVVQQTAVEDGGASSRAHEADADRAALGYVTEGRARPAATAGLSFQRCPKSSSLPADAQSTPAQVSEILSVSAKKSLAGYLDPQKAKNMKLLVQSNQDYREDFKKNAAEHGFSPDSEQVKQDMDSTAGFARFSDQSAHVPEDPNRGALGYAVHEVIHLFSAPEFRSTMGFELVEGTTEYFTNIALDDAGYSPVEDSRYGPFVAKVHALIDALNDDHAKTTKTPAPMEAKSCGGPVRQRRGTQGEKILKEAYFKGKVRGGDGLEGAFDRIHGAGKFEEMVSKNAEKAREVKGR